VARGRILIAPSILTADFMELGREVEAAERGGADVWHLDVMDGHFVPNITIGTPEVAAIRAVSKKRIDAHLMVSNPAEVVGWFAKAGADLCAIHVEPGGTDAGIRAIREAGAKVGLSLNPSTPVEAIIPYVHFADQILIMTVNPGFGGQKFIPEPMKKVAPILEAARRQGVRVEVGIDGGVNVETIEAVIATGGVDLVVAGGAAFRKGTDSEDNVRKLRQRIESLSAGG
jgi:ribulose-phosphate 3-epimerase